MITLASEGKETVTGSSWDSLSMSYTLWNRNLIFTTWSFLKPNTQKSVFVDGYGIRTFGGILNNSAHFLKDRRMICHKKYVRWKKPINVFNASLFPNKMEFLGPKGSMRWLCACQARRSLEFDAHYPHLLPRTDKHRPDGPPEQLTWRGLHDQGKPPWQWPPFNKGNFVFTQSLALWFYVLSSIYMSASLDQSQHNYCRAKESSEIYPDKFPLEKMEGDSLAQ